MARNALLVALVILAAGCIGGPAEPDGTVGTAEAPHHRPSPSTWALACPGKPQACPLTFSYDGARYQAPRMDMNPLDPMHLVIAAEAVVDVPRPDANGAWTTTSQVHLYETLDGGVNWNLTLLDNPDGPVGELIPYALNKTLEPQVRFTADGILVVAVEARSDPNWIGPWWFMARSGGTWTSWSSGETPGFGEGELVRWGDRLALTFARDDEGAVLLGHPEGNWTWSRIPDGVACHGFRAMAHGEDLLGICGQVRRQNMGLGLSTSTIYGATIWRATTPHFALASATDDLPCGVRRAAGFGEDRVLVVGHYCGSAVRGETIEDAQMVAANLVNQTWSTPRSLREAITLDDLWASVRVQEVGSDTWGNAHIFLSGPVSDGSGADLGPHELLHVVVDTQMQVLHAGLIDTAATGGPLHGVSLAVGEPSWVAWRASDGLRVASLVAG